METSTTRNSCPNTRAAFGIFEQEERDDSSLIFDSARLIVRVRECQDKAKYQRPE
jgi:hypothetical protein